MTIDEARAESAGPRNPVARERAVPAEPAVVVANGIAAFDEWGHALGARVHDGRTRADTIPAKSELAGGGGRSTTMLVVAAAFLFLASAAVLVRGVRASERETAVAAATAVRAQVLVTSAAAVAEAPGPAAPAIPVAELPVSEPAPVEEVVAPRGTPIVRASITAERPERPAAPRRARPAAKPKRSSAGGSGEIVRETPY